MFFVVTVSGYFVVAGTLYWLLVWRQNAAVTSAIAPSVLRLPKKTCHLESLKLTQRSGNSQKVTWISNWQTGWRAVRHDITLSVWSCGIFAICASIMTSLYTAGYTQLYLTPDKYGIGYLGLSLVLVIFLQDTYFYFTHRLAHHPKCYRWLHRGHHHSNNPTPWTAFAFDPAEAVVQALYVMGAVCLIPMHLSVLCAVVLVMSMGALCHHISLRLFAASAFGDWLGSWVVGPTHHWFHHRKYTVHYGLYFTFWDRVMGTHTSGYADILSPERPSQVAEVSNTAEAESVALQTPPVLTAVNCDTKTVPFSSPLKKAS
ncbi:MAG: sterol desaturase family protein [Cyanobacteria bacterium J06607_13]